MLSLRKNHSVQQLKLIKLSIINKVARSKGSYWPRQSIVPSTLMIRLQLILEFMKFCNNVVKLTLTVWSLWINAVLTQNIYFYSFAHSCTIHSDIKAGTYRVNDLMKRLADVKTKRRGSQRTQSQVICSEHLIATSRRVFSVVLPHIVLTKCWKGWQTYWCIF